MTNNRAEQGELIPIRDASPRRGRGRPRAGRHESALNKAVKDACLDGNRNAAAVSLARSFAKQLDDAEQPNVDFGKASFAVAQVGREYRETLARLGLIEAAQAPEADPLDGFGDDDDQVDDPAAPDV